MEQDWSGDSFDQVVSAARTEWDRTLSQVNLSTLLFALMLALSVYID